MSIRYVAVVEQSEGFNYIKAPRIFLTFGRLPSGFARNIHARKLGFQRLQSLVTSDLKGYLPRPSDRLLIWELNEDNSLRLFVTGMLDVREGKLSREESLKKSARLEHQITCKQEMTTGCVRISATAAMTFDVGYDLEGTDYESDSAMAEELVRQNCDLLDDICVTHVERDSDTLRINFEFTFDFETDVPWKNSRFSPDQLNYLCMRAIDHLDSQIYADDFYLLNVKCGKSWISKIPSRQE